MTRVDSVLFEAALATGEAAIENLAHNAHLVVLSQDDRARIHRPRDGFPAAARTLIHAASAEPALLSAAAFDTAAVLEDLDNVSALDTALSAVRELLQRLEDSRLAWLAEAWEPTSRLYKMARVRAEADGHLREVVEPLAEVLSNPPRKKAEEGA